MNTNAKSRDWCFTSFNLENYEKFKNIKNSEYVIYQVETCPETNKKHLQGFIQFKNPRSMSGIKKLLKDNQIHLQTRYSTVENAINYCKKDDSRDNNYERIEYGNANMNDNKGKRNDLNEMYNMIKNGCTIDEIKEYNPSAYIRYYKAFDRLYNDEQSKLCGEFKNIEVNILYGNAGTGKTSYIMQKHGANNVYKLEKGNNDNLWFDGYKGQEVLLIDDFYGWIKYSKILNLIDGYKMMLEIKGGVTYSNWKYIYITSNESPEKWYKQGLTKALNRRIDNIFNVPNLGKLIKQNKMFNLTKQVIDIKTIKWEIIDDDDKNNANETILKMDSGTEVTSNTIRSLSVNPNDKNYIKNYIDDNIENMELEKIDLLWKNAINEYNYKCDNNKNINYILNKFG